MSKILNTITSLATLGMAATPLAAIPAFAHAEEARIPVSDLSFASRGDTKEFVRRVDRAAAQLCRTSPASLGVYAACRQAVQDEAVSKLGAAQRQAFEANLSARADAPFLRASAD